MFDHFPFFFALLRVARVLYREEVNALRLDAFDWLIENKTPLCVVGMRGKAAIIECIGNKATYCRMETVSVIQEYSALGAYSGLVPQQKIQDRQAGVSRMDTLDRLTQLHLV